MDLTLDKCWFLRLYLYLAIEEFLKDKHGKYAFGDNITATDIVLYPHLFLAKYRFKVN